MKITVVIIKKNSRKLFFFFTIEMKNIKIQKSDIIFKKKKIFGKKEYIIDLLNAILKFKEDEKITDLHYLDEQVFTKTIQNS